MTRRQWIVSIILTLAVLLAGTFMFQFFRAQKTSTVDATSGPPPLKEVLVGTFTPASIPNNISIDGRVQAFEKIDLSAEVTGRLEQTDILPREGRYFKKGQVLFEVDRTDARLALYAKRSDLLNSITQMMPDLKFDYPASFDKWRTYLDAFDVEKTLAPFPEVSDPKEKYYLASRTIYSQFYSIKADEDRLGDYTVKAPFSGVFLSVSKYPGSLVTPGVALASVMNTGSFELVAPISSGDFQYVSIGQEVKLTSSGQEGSWTGKVSRISRQIDQATQSVPVYISVYGKELRDGMYLQGSLTGKQIDGAVVLPRSAIVDQSDVYVVQDSSLVKTPIEVVKRQGEMTIVRGITIEDRVVTEGVQGLFDGQKVAPQQ